MFMDSLGVGFSDVALGLLAALKAHQTWGARKRSPEGPNNAPITGALAAPSPEGRFAPVEDSAPRICTILRPDGTYHSTRPLGHPDLDEFRKEGFTVL